MDLKDDKDYEKEDRQTLVGRLMKAQAWANFMDRAFDALVSFGVNFKLLPEYTDTELLDHATKVKEPQAQTFVMQWIERLQSGVMAAVRRKQLTLHKGGKYDGPTKH